jgi:hypothetical protein
MTKTPGGATRTEALVGHRPFGPPAQTPPPSAGSGCGTRSTSHCTRVFCWLIVLSIGAALIYLCLHYWVVAIVALAVLLAFSLPICLFDDYGPSKRHSRIADCPGFDGPGNR